MTSADPIALLNGHTIVRVSSTLDKSTGKKNLIDGSPETCWASQQGLPQFIQLAFPEPITPHRLSITFQGGFVGTRCAVCIATSEDPSNSKKDWRVLTHVYPEDVNRRQNFSLPAKGLVLSEGVDSVKLIFEQSSDFFGRITVYDLQLFGTIAPEKS